MCSTIAARIAGICAAIDELAARPPERRADATADNDDAPEDRVAAIWAMIADVNPELAKRLPGYLGSAD